MTAERAPTTRPEHPPWYGMDVRAVTKDLDVDPDRGLTASEAAERLRTHGPNKLAGAKKESGFRAFLRQYQDFMQLILLGAAIVNALVTDDTGTTVLLAALTVFNAVIGLRQESKAEESVAALAQMMKTVARVRRDGQAVEIDAEELVPGDVVLVEAGNRIPADGRIFVAATLEIEEAALTGESLPVGKQTEPVAGEDVPLGDRICIAYMNTSVTRGRGEFIVTETGMGTEIGHIANMLANTESEKTPLQKQLDGLSKIIASIAGVALVLVVVLGLINGDSFDTLFVTGVTLAVAAIPTGLPAVVTALLSIGTREIARRNAIVKRLPAVETLGSTSAICSDKTGTLTLNKMTARELMIPGQNRFTVSGEGYGTQGEIKHVGGSHFDLDPYLLPTVLCADAVLDGESLIGDPTEGALIVLGAKGGLDIEETRATYPRIAEVPFDSEYKFMATFHEMTGTDGRPIVRCYVKGAPDVLISRGGSYRDPDGTLLPVTEDNRHLALDANDRIAEAGERVMVVAQREFDPATFDKDANLIDLIQDLTLLAMVGIVDPPRAEARDAIAKCKSAGIRVRMITGDHATTAGAIGAELGIEGRAITGRGVRGHERRGADRAALRHRGDRARRPGGQGPSGQDAPTERQHRCDDRGWGERRPGPQVSQHRRGDGHHRHRGLQGGRRDDPDRRQLRHDRRRGRIRARVVRQPPEVPAVPDVDAGRLHRDLHRRRHLRHRRRDPAEPAADPVDQHGHRHPDRRRARVRRADAEAS